jgi:hypothetical protein
MRSGSGRRTVREVFKDIELGDHARGMLAVDSDDRVGPT